jgi:hypothetical protein
VGTFSLLLLLTTAVAATFLVQAVVLDAAPGPRRHEPRPKERSPGDSMVVG